jgi:hypothetical protein
MDDELEEAIIFFFAKIAAALSSISVSVFVQEVRAQGIVVQNSFFGGVKLRIDRYIYQGGKRNMSRVHFIISIYVICM